ncbi:MAG: dTDP-4-dehydrorhamnose 3,5-epimerase [Alphaproteobacteria bacterium]|nr:dTDP-4-dehydrorhamnose 3,5-epimerase [Alphaproteobacteria bacterium]
MRFTPLDIKGAWLIDIEPIADERGSFARTVCAREFAQHGMATNYPQHSISHNLKKGTLRGMHFQTAPHAEAKLVGCIRGAIFDVCLDLRPDSPSFLRWQGFELSAENQRQLYIPEGCAHGFQALSDDALVNYRISEFYAPDASVGYRYNDPKFAISWPLPVTMISDRDRDLPDFAG